MLSFLYPTFLFPVTEAWVSFSSTISSFSLKQIAGLLGLFLPCGVDIEPDHQNWNRLPTGRDRRTNNPLPISTEHPTAFVSLSQHRTMTSSNDDSSHQQQLFHSTTAPGAVFATRAELTAHYASPWHRYNLQRRANGLPAVTWMDFEARAAAAAALQADKIAQQQRNKTDHLKRKNKNGKQQHKKQQNESKHAQEADGDTVMKDSGEPPASVEAGPTEAHTLVVEPETVPDDASSCLAEESTSAPEDPAVIEIDPCQSLFCSHTSLSPEANARFLQDTYGFFLPDREYLVDLEGLLGYCHEKLRIGRTCLYCEKQFATGAATIQHAIDASHTKLRYDPDVDLHEYDVFYDFAAADAAFLGEVETTAAADNDVEVEGDDDDDDNEEDNWEDVDDDEDGDDWCEGYREQVTRSMGLDVTPLGELIFPDGRIVGHRNLRRYYKQQSSRASNRPESAAIILARRAAYDQLVNGRVINLSQNNQVMEQQRGKGLLVASNGTSSFTQLSMYRYRAAVRKQQLSDRRRTKLYNRNFQNINKMDKKHNRLMNGVSVAHAAR